MEAEITIEYDDVTLAEAVADAVSPDNYGTPAGLSVDTRAEKTKLVTKIKSCEGFPTFVATIDDLLFSVTTAEKALLETIRLRRRKQTRGPTVCGMHSQESL